jgi:hypothetical protein
MPAMGRAFFISLMLLCALNAQDVGMGARRGTGARLETPYSLELETPHVKWAKPLSKGPIRILAVPAVSEGRTVVELAQRLSLDLTTVSIDANFDINKWTMALGRDYGARAERGDFSRIYGYLEEELTGSKQFDVILLQTSHGWDAMTAKSREALVRRVREGCGLVWVRPFTSEVSPLEPAQPVASPRSPFTTVEPGKTEASPWRRVSDHYITKPIPVESFPFSYLENYLYRAPAGSTVLIESGSGHPVLAVRDVGRGRVVGFAYRNGGLSWQMPRSANGFVSDRAWEGYYAMMCRALIYAARREADAAGEWKVPPEPAPTRRVTQLQTAAKVVREGEPVEVTFQSPEAVTVELSDGFGRVIARTRAAGRASLPPGRPLTHSGFLTAGDAKIAVQFAAPVRDWTDYEVIMPWYGPRSYQPWTPAVDEQFRKAGITTLANPDRNFKLIGSAGLHDVFGVYAYRNANYAKKKAAYAETKDKKYLTRDVVLQEPGFVESLRDQLTARLGPLAPLKPLAYYLADESSLTSYTDAFDVDWAPAALAGFREWLRKEYPNLEALNASWGTSFRDWESVLPMTTEEAQQHGNFSPWADHRAYMESALVKALDQARQIVHEIDPGAPASISGTQVPTAHNGANWYAIDQIVDYLQPYSGGNQDAMHHLFRPGIKLTGFTGYGKSGADLHYEQWQRLFYGHTGASIFWHYTVLNPDLTLSPQGHAMQDVFGRIQSGVGRVFMNSTVREDGVAIHFSMASIRGAWITDGRIRPNVGNVRGTSKAYDALVASRQAWVKQLEDQGIQFRFLATPQIEQGDLDRYRVLILPYSIAISDREARAIERFLDRGGIVLADDQSGRMDERCHWRKAPLWAEGRKGLLRQPPGRVPVDSAFPVEGAFLTTIRNFGASRLIGLLPSAKTTVRLPETKLVRYDLFRGGLAEASYEAAPDAPVLLLERSTRIARLALASTGDATVAVSLTDEKGAPVDLSAVRLEVSDPTGRLVRHYSGNVTVREGKSELTIPFALNDGAGNWRVRARDAVSGLTADHSLRR